MYTSGMEANDSKPLVLTPTEVARELGVSLETVGNLRRRGQLAGTRVAAGEHRATWRFTPEDVLRYLDSINERERTP
jgi:excisionase family DNA binding protein